MENRLDFLNSFTSGKAPFFFSSHSHSSVKIYINFVWQIDKKQNLKSSSPKNYILSWVEYKKVILNESQKG